MRFGQNRWESHVTHAVYVFELPEIATLRQAQGRLAAALAMTNCSSAGDFETVCVDSRATQTAAVEAAL